MTAIQSLEPRKQKIEIMTWLLSLAIWVYEFPIPMMTAATRDFVVSPPVPFLLVFGPPKTTIETNKIIQHAKTNNVTEAET